MSTSIVTFQVPLREFFPTDVVRLTFDYSGVAGVVADHISSAVVTAAGLTVGTPSVLTGGLKVQVLLSGFTAGTQYTVMCKATTIGGQNIGGPLRINGISL